MTGRFSQQNSDRSSSTNPAGASAMIVQKRRGRPRIVPESAAADFRLLKSSPIKPPLEGGGGRNNDDVYALDFFGDLDRQNEPVAKKKYKKSSSVKFKQQLTAANSSSKIYHPSSSVFPGNGVFYREERGGKAPPRDEEDPFHFSSASANTREHSPSASSFSTIADIVEEVRQERQRNSLKETGEHITAEGGNEDLVFTEKFPFFLELKKLTELDFLIKRCDIKAPVSDTHDEVMDFLNKTANQLPSTSSVRRFSDSNDDDIKCHVFENEEEFTHFSECMRLLPDACSYLTEAQQLLSNIRGHLKGCLIYRRLKEQLSTEFSPQPSTSSALNLPSPKEEGELIPISEIRLPHGDGEDDQTRKVASMQRLLDEFNRLHQKTASAAAGCNDIGGEEKLSRSLDVFDALNNLLNLVESESLQPQTAVKIEPKNTSSSSFNSFKPDCDHLHLLNTEFPRSIVSDPLSVKDSLRSLPQSFQQFIFNSNNKNSSSVVGRRYRKRIRRKKQRRRRLPLSIFEDEDDEAEIPVGKNATDQKYCPKKKNDDEKWESPENLGQLAERLQMFFVDSKDRLKSALKTLEVLASFSNHQNFSEAPLSSSKPSGRAPSFKLPVVYNPTASILMNPSGHAVKAMFTQSLIDEAESDPSFHQHQNCSMMDTKDGGGNKPGGAVANGSNNSSSSSSASRENSAEDNNYLLIGDLRKLNSESVHLSAMALSRLRHRYPAEKMFGGSGHQDKPTKTPPVVNPRPNSSKNAGPETTQQQPNDALRDHRGFLPSLEHYIPSSTSSSDNSSHSQQQLYLEERISETREMLATLQNVMRTNVDLLGQSSEALSELKFFCPSSELQQNNSPNSIASHFLLMKMKKKGDDQQQDSAESSSSDDDEGGGGGGAAKRGSNSSNANNRLRENPRRGGGIQPRRGIISNKISPAPANTGGGGAPFGRSRMSLH